MGFLVQGNRERVIGPHFHENDQFQVVVSGGGVLGKHKLAVRAVHFSRAYTPSGPINFGGEVWDSSPCARARTRVRNTSPKRATNSSSAEPPAVAGYRSARLHARGRRQRAAVQPDQGWRGLAAFSLSLAPNAAVTAPEPSHSGGQHIIVTKGSLTYQAREYKAVTVAFVEPHEGAWQITAGAEGLEAMVLNYPRREGVAANDAVAAKAPGHRVWRCACAFVYDESKGMPDDGVAAAPAGKTCRKAGRAPTARRARATSR